MVKRVQNAFAGGYGQGVRTPRADPRTDSGRRRFIRGFSLKVDYGVGFRSRIHGSDSGIDGSDSGIGFKGRIQESNSGVGFRDRMQRSNSGVEFRCRIQGSDSGIGFRSRIQGSDSGVRFRGQALSHGRVLDFLSQAEKRPNTEPQGVPEILDDTVR